MTREFEPVDTSGKLGDVLVWIEDDIGWVKTVIDYCEGSAGLPTYVVELKGHNFDERSFDHFAMREREKPALLFFLTLGIPDMDLLTNLLAQIMPRAVISDLKIGGDPIAGISILSRVLRLYPRPYTALVSAEVSEGILRLVKEIGPIDVVLKGKTNELLPKLFSRIFPNTPWIRQREPGIVAEIERLKRENRKLRYKVKSLAQGAASSRKKTAAAATVARNKDSEADVEKLKKALEHSEHTCRMLLAQQHDLLNSTILVSDTLDNICSEPELIPPILSDKLTRIKIASKHSTVLVASANDLVASTRKKSEGLGDVPKCLHEAIEIVSTKLPASIKMEADIPKDLPPCVVPNDLLVRCAINLLVNSLEAIKDRGCIQITAKVNQVHRKKFVSVVIKDDGKGIKKADLSRIFNWDFSTKPKKFGFGLYIVKRVMDEHNGEVRIMSKPGKGTAVTLQIPVM